MAPVIKVEGLGKRYWLAPRQRESYTALRDVLAKGVKDLFTHSNKKEDQKEAFWALKDIHFEVEQGEVLGIIGPNGAGKSTLLKILSRITEPTIGRVTLHGRVASLLEVGTGFHPELTGRENIYLSGAILGMSRSEIRRQFDEIVDFSGVEAFLDTPVKRYSSGMRVRLGFAVAAHLQPEILLIDEVLAVGDAMFQKKCLGKMDEVARGGRTVLFVSHDLGMVSSICENAILLDQGTLVERNSSELVVKRYHQKIDEKLVDSEADLLEKRTDRTGSFEVRIEKISLVDEHNNVAYSAKSGEPLKLLITYKKNIFRNIDQFRIDFRINDSNGKRLIWFSSSLSSSLKKCVIRNSGTMILSIQRLPLVPGTYSLTYYATGSHQVLDYLEDAFLFEVIRGNFYDNGELPPKGQAEFLADFDLQINQHH